MIRSELYAIRFARTTAALKVERRAIKREPVTLKLPCAISVNNLFANVPGRGRVPSSRYKSWKAEAANMIVQQGRPHIIGPIELSMMFQEDGCRADLGNLEKAVTDILVSMRVIEGDSKATVRKIILQWLDTQGTLVHIVPSAEKWVTRKGLAKA